MNLPEKFKCIHNYGRWRLTPCVHGCNDEASDDDTFAAALTFTAEHQMRNEWMPVRQAAIRLGISRHTVLTLALRHELDVEDIGGRFFATTRSVGEYEQKRNGPTGAHRQRSEPIDPPTHPKARTASIAKRSPMRQPNICKERLEV